MVLPTYPQGRILLRTEGITRVGSQFFVDPTVFSVGLLAESWDRSHVDEREVIIDREKAWEGQDYLDMDYVLVGPIGGNEKPVSLGYQFSNETIRLKFTILSKGLRGTQGGAEDIHIVKLVEEVRRIILANRQFYFTFNTAVGAGNMEPQGRSWITWGVAVSPEDRIKRGHTRRVYDCEIKNVYRQVVTAWGA